MDFVTNAVRTTPFVRKTTSQSIDVRNPVGSSIVDEQQ